jgi:hypothetical protein
MLFLALFKKELTNTRFLNSSPSKVKQSSDVHHASQTIIYSKDKLPRLIFKVKNRYPYLVKKNLEVS